VNLILVNHGIVSDRESSLGTGKTTTARKIGQVFYDMRFLASADVVECSATDLIAGYVGQTGLKTTEVLEKALGKVLFIDEAYRLGEGYFATEAINTLVDSLTKPRFIGKMIVVLAGYEDDMNKLLSINPGLSSRFSEEVVFKNMRPEDCLKLLELKLEKAGVSIDQNGDPSGSNKVTEIFRALSDLPFWGNGRDVETLAKSITRATILEDTTNVLRVSTARLIEHLNGFMKERRARSTPSRPKPFDKLQNHPIAFNFDQSTAPPPPANIIATAAPIVNEAEAQPAEPASNSSSPEARDDGVSDTIWNQLEHDKAAQEELQTRLKSSELLAEQERECATVAEETSAKELDALAKQAALEQESNELKRRHEEMRLKRLALLQAREEAENRARKIREEAERKRKEEARVQTKLRHMGVCVAGFRWIKQDDGYRCAGGAHFVGNDALGI
jgi:hypothetical protein